MLVKRLSKVAAVCDDCGKERKFNVLYIHENISNRGVRDIFVSDRVCWKCNIRHEMKHKKIRRKWL